MAAYMPLASLQITLGRWPSYRGTINVLPMHMEELDSGKRRTYGLEKGGKVLWSRVH